MSTEGQLRPAPLLEPDGTSPSGVLSLILRRRPTTKTVTSRRPLMPRLLALADVLALAAAFLVSQALLAENGSSGAGALDTELALFVLVLATWLVGAKLSGLYDRDEERVAHSTADEVGRVFVVATVAFFLVAVVCFLIGKTPGILGLGDTDNPNSSTTVLFWILAFVFIIGGRIGARALARRANVYLQPAIVIGTGEIGQLIGRKLLRHSEYGITLVGFIDEKSKEPESSLHELPIPGRDGHHLPILGAPDVHDVPVLGGLDSLERVVGQFRVARAIVAPSIDHDSHLLEPVRTLRALGVHVDIVPRLFEAVGVTHDVHSVEGISLLGLSPITRSRVSQLIKRAIDLFGAAVGLAVTAPFFVVVGVLIKANSPGPVFFRQTRLGKDMRTFTLLKFRTMKTDTDERVHEEFIAATMRSHDPPSDDGLYKLSREDDVTEIGRWLRRTSLDELPQLINVLRGEMSLVGPRPCIPYEVKDFKPHHFDRFLVPAGMTGFWQTSARAHATYAEALDMDALYAQSWSLGLDFLLLARTPPQLLAAKATR